MGGPTVHVVRDSGANSTEPQDKLRYTEDEKNHHAFEYRHVKSITSFVTFAHILPQPVLGAVLAALIALAAYRARALTISGAVSAWIIGAIIFGVGGWGWGAALITFFVTSSGLSRWRGRRKARMGFAKGGRRDAGQVWANGGAAAACALLARLVPFGLAHLLFLAALAAANADTWATEIGAALGGTPRDLRTGRRVPPGTSGAVSAAGTAAALAGALLLGLFAAPQGAGSVVVVTAAGLAGALVDSLLGATVQAQWRDPADSERWTERGAGAPARGLAWVGNDLVNLACTLSAVGAAAALSRLLGHPLETPPPFR